MEQNYIELLHKVGAEKFDSRFAELQKQIEEFLIAAQYISASGEDNHAECNDRILRRKPIQIDNSVEKDKDIFINERFVCYMILYECLQQKQKKTESLRLDELSAEKYDKYIDLLLYFLKYREYNAQMLELLIETFKAGIMFGEVV